MIRNAQKGALDVERAKKLVESLTIKKYPLIEEVDGRIYFHHPKKSAVDVALMALAYRYPERTGESEIVDTVRRHGFRTNNAQMAVRRIKKFIDDDGRGQLLLLAPGLKRAEQIMNRTEGVR